MTHDEAMARLRAVEALPVGERMARRDTAPISFHDRHLWVELIDRSFELGQFSQRNFDASSTPQIRGDGWRHYARPLRVARNRLKRRDAEWRKAMRAGGRHRCRHGEAVTRDEAVAMCARYHMALVSMRTFSSVDGGECRQSVGVKEAQDAEDAIISALVSMSDDNARLREAAGNALLYVHNVGCACDVGMTGPCDASRAFLRRSIAGTVKP